MNLDPMCSICTHVLRALRGLALCPRCDRPVIRQIQGQRPLPTPSDALTVPDRWESP